MQLSNFKKPKRNPGWASVSPDGQTVAFVRNYNLWWMDKPNYEKVLQNENDSTIIEHQLTKDGIENFGYGTDSSGTNNVDKEKNKKIENLYVFTGARTLNILLW